MDSPYELNFKVDVKSHKYKRVNGPLLQGYYWIEWINVTGHKGWITGKADYIAFIYYNYIYTYPRIELKNTAYDMIDFTKSVNKPSDAINCLYTRDGRRDKISLISISDLHKKLKPSMTWTIN